MHLFGRRWWLSAALLLLLALSSPLTWLAQGAQTVLPCATPCATPCCPPVAALAMPCCQLAPVPLSVAVLAPARAQLARTRALAAPAIFISPARPRFHGTAPNFPIQLALPPPQAARKRTDSCRAPPLQANIYQRDYKEVKPL